METFESFLVCRDGIAQKNAKNRIALAGLDCSTLFIETDFMSAISKPEVTES